MYISGVNCHCWAAINYNLKLSKMRTPLHTITKHQVGLSVVINRELGDHRVMDVRLKVSELVQVITRKGKRLPLGPNPLVKPRRQDPADKKNALRVGPENCIKLDLRHVSRLEIQDLISDNIYLTFEVI